MCYSKEWTLGNAIQRLRMEQGITLSQLSEGLCSIAAMNRIENEGVDISLILVNRILGRLGCNPDKFEIYTGKTEFDQLEQRILIQTCIRDKNIELAEKELKDYRQKLHTCGDADKLQDQFVKSMTGHLAVLKGNAEEGISLFEQAIKISVPDWKKADILKLVLSEEELKLLCSLADAYELCSEKQKAYSIRKKIIDYIEYRRIGKDLKPQLLSEVICKTVPFLIEEGNAQIGSELCDRCLKALSDTKRMYCWPNLLQLKAECLEELYKDDALKNDEIIEFYQKAYYIYDLFGDLDTANKMKLHLEERYGWESI